MVHGKKLLKYSVKLLPESLPLKLWGQHKTENEYIKVKSPYKIGGGGEPVLTVIIPIFSMVGLKCIKFCYISWRKTKKKRGGGKRKR